MQFLRWIWVSLVLVLACELTACDDRQRRVADEVTRMATREKLPDPVKSKNGLSYIPIDDTAFLIPEKTWLKGYSRNSTDGMVYSITLHATVPDVQP
jgi:hypothetical protein